MNGKIMLTALAAVLLCLPARAHFPVSVSTATDDGLISVGWSPVQFGVYTEYPLQLVPGRTDVYGVAVGILNLRQHSAVLSLSLENRVAENYFLQAGVFSTCERNYALELGLFNFTQRNYGVSFGLLNIESNFGCRYEHDLYSPTLGLQIGLFNAGGGIQIGLLNHNPQGFLSWFPFVNFPCRE